MVRAAFIVVRDRSGLRPVFGVPAVRRLVLVAAGLGFDVIHVLAPDDALRRVLSDLIPAHAFHVISEVRELSCMAERLGLADEDRALVMQAGHVIDRWSLRQLLKTGNGGNWRTCAHDGGKMNGEGPIWMVTAGHLSSVLCAIWSPDEPACAAGPAAERVRIAGGLPLLLADGVQGTKAAEACLLDALGRSTAATDSFLSRHIHRPISRFITKGLAKTAVTPNAVTLFNIVVGLAGAFFLAKGVYVLQLLGSLLFLSSTILDGVDGELARLTLKESVFGHYLDIVGDNVVHVAVFFGIALGLYRHTSDPVYLHALGILLCGFGLCAFAVHRLMGHGPEKHGSEEAPWLAALLVNRDFAYLVVFLALLHRLNWFLFGTALGVYVVAMALFAMSLTRRPTASV
jgi:phosphatidylglycerophosphate synthase